MEVRCYTERDTYTNSLFFLVANILFYRLHQNYLLGGKSAIVSAITVALGAKANATNRGRNLSALIREGAK